MIAASSTGTSEQFEIRIGRDRYDHADQDGSHMQILNDDEFIELLRNRLGKTTAEVNKLLDFYRQSAGKI